MSNRTALRVRLALALAVAVAVSFGSRTALAHCDTMSGPVITAAKQAPESGDAAGFDTYRALRRVR
jgi:hypothetical protein